MKLVLAAILTLAFSGAAFAQAAHDMSKMPDSAAAAPAGAQGSGVVKKIDAKAGAITLQHGPIAALSWPAMTMAFKADPALLAAIKVGQQVTFSVKTSEGPPELVAIHAK